MVIRFKLSSPIGVAHVHINEHLNFGWFHPSVLNFLPFHIPWTHNFNLREKLCLIHCILNVGQVWDQVPSCSNKNRFSFPNRCGSTSNANRRCKCCKPMYQSILKILISLTGMNNVWSLQDLKAKKSAVQPLVWLMILLTWHLLPHTHTHKKKEVRKNKLK